MNDRIGNNVTRQRKPLTDAFLDHLARRELWIARDRRSGAMIDFAALNRLASDTEVEWVRASGQARLASFVVYRRQYHPDFPPPYNVAMVTLAEGPDLISTVTAELAALKIGMPLEANFDSAGRLVFAPLRTT